MSPHPHGRTRRDALLSGAGALVFLALPAAARADDEAARAVVQTFLGGLGGLPAGASRPERIAALRPVLDATLDLPRIAAGAVGTLRMESWDAERQQTVIDAVGDYMAVVLAVRAETTDFRALELGGTRPGPGGRLVVDARLDGEIFGFLVGEGESGWRIVDVMRGGVSELALRRSEFNAAAAEGPDVLAGRLRDQAASLAGDGA